MKLQADYCKSASILLQPCRGTEGKAYVTLKNSQLSLILRDQAHTFRCPNLKTSPPTGMY